MRRKLIIPLAACLIGIAALTSHVLAQATPVTPEPNGPGSHQGAARGHHPAIHQAIRALEAAKVDMQAAAHDFGGHRVDAIAACDAAIAQLKLALQYANNPAGTPAAPPSP